MSTKRSIDDDFNYINTLIQKERLTPREFLERVAGFLAKHSSNRLEHLTEFDKPAVADAHRWLKPAAALQVLYETL